MPFVEQLLYGQESSTSRKRVVLTQSPGMNPAVAGEIRQLCEGWGDLPVGGLARPVLLSVPLKKSLESQRGRLYAVVHLSPGHDTLFHAVVVSDADYGALGHNPYALARSMIFTTGWREGILLDRIEFAASADANLVDPPPGRADMALVCESLRHILLQKHLHLPLAQPEEGSDRTLALIIASLPTPLRRELRFASLAGSERGGFQLAALSTPNCHFAGWQRLLLTQVAAIVPDEVEQYVGAIGSFLAAGDLPGVCRLAREQVTMPGGGAAKPRERSFGVRQPRQTEKSDAPRARAAVPTAPRTVTPLVPVSGTIQRRETPPVRQRPARSGSARTGVVRRSHARSGVKGGAGPRLLALTAAGMLLTALFWWRLPDVMRLTEEHLGWQRSGEEHEEKHTGTLLSVIDVGEVYERLVRRGAKAGALGEGEQRDRRASLLEMQTDAAGPLLDQVQVFVDLAGEGMQQVTRPDREAQRLHALAEQGERLDQEMRRLELAWYSLSSGTDWRDLSRLVDAEVAARRDSLVRADKSALVASARTLGTADSRKSLQTARRRVDGMARLIDLMWQEDWSSGWEKQLETAAEMVSPRASAATRAYRNSAFAYVRLKRAERSPAAVDLPFAPEFADGAWPAREVRDVLPELRNQMARFGRGDAPPILKATLDLYARLEQCATLARDAAADDALDRLAQNAAVRFDPATYENYLERIRFEAVRGLLEADRDSTGIPLHLYSGDDSLAAYRFYEVLLDTTGPLGWRDEQERQSRPFLARWARHQEEVTLRAELDRQEGFDEDWDVCVGLAETVRRRAAAGGDWTAVWLDLHEKTTILLDEHAAHLGGDRRRATRLQQAGALLRVLDEARPLTVRAATVRLPLGAPPLGDRCLVVLQTADGTVLRGDPIDLGPAAPQESGRVGTVSLDWQLVMDSAADVTVTVRDPDTDTVLFSVDYPSLSERAGPGAMARPRGGEAGTVTFQLDPGWWSGLQVPVLD
jgi:hypothetical protein